MKEDCFGDAATVTEFIVGARLTAPRNDELKYSQRKCKVYVKSFTSLFRGKNDYLHY